MKRGRKPKLTKDLIQLIAELMAEGHYIVDICKGVRIAPKTFYEWKKDAEKLVQAVMEEEVLFDSLSEREKLLIHFLANIQDAEIHAKMNALRNIREAGKTDWRAEAWFMDRRYKNLFSN